MKVRISPIGREPRTFFVGGVKRSYSSTLGGMATAEVPMFVPKEMMERLLLAKVEIAGENGIDWVGRVWGRTSTGGLLCSGTQMGMSCVRHGHLYARSGFNGFGPIATSVTNNGAVFTVTNDELGLTILQRSGTTADTDDYMGHYIWFPDHTIDAIAYNATVNHDDCAAESMYSNTEGARSGTLDSYAPSAGLPATSSISASVSSKHGILLRNRITATPSNPSTPDKWVRFAALRLYGQADTSLSVEDVLGMLLDNVESEWFPSGDAYRAFIETSGDTVNDLVSEANDTLSKTLGRVMALTDHLWGFYVESIAGVPTSVPHLYPVSDSVDWVVDVREPGVEYDEPPESASGLYSKMVVGYEDTKARPVHTTVTDSDDDSYLNVIEMRRDGQVNVSTTSSTEATAAGNAALATDPYSITVTIPRLVSVLGARWPLSAMRPGHLFRVDGLPNGHATGYLIDAEIIDDTRAKIRLTREKNELRRLAVS